MSNVATMWALQKDEIGVVLGFANLKDAYIQRMREIGIDIGSSIRCLNRPPLSAPRQYQIGDGVFAFDQAIASSIKIDPVS